MNRTVFSLPARSEYRTAGGLAVTRSVEQFSGGANRLDELIELLDRRPGVVLSSGTTVPGRYESFDLGFSDPPLRLQTKASEFWLEAMNARGEVLIAFLGDSLREPCVAITQKNGSQLAGHIVRGAAPIDEEQATVETARAAFARGDLFEAVPGQLFAEACERSPAEVFQRLCRINPSPYGALMNLGDGEFLVSASPEMFVRSDGKRVETCPISGTIARGVDAIGDAEQIRQLLNSQKDEFELNMCTDVDRNDKARVCVPGTIKVLARRQIETYSKLFHTVDHVEGMLRPGFDALDAFLTHAWAVTVTGAPKLWAMQFVEDQERSSRRWYAGAIGAVNFDGSINTGLTIRTIRMKDGLAEVRVGATCLFDSDPAAEDRECQVKAAALFQALRGDPPKPLSTFAPDATGSGKQVLLIDHDDSFVHMLADYFRQVGASVSVVRYIHAQQMLNHKNWDLLVLSPGPGRPQDFGISKTIEAALQKGLPVFGVCLGVQAIGEYFGGQLGQLHHPAHGRPSQVQVRGGRLMQNLPNEIVIGRYNSLYVERDSMPDVLAVTASTEDGVAMAIEHKTLPVGGVQFHPESLMSLGGEVGLRIVENAFRLGMPVN